MNKEQITKAQLLLSDLGMLDNLKQSVTVELYYGNTIKITLPFNSSFVSQKVASVIAHAINGSASMNKVRKEVKQEVRALMKEII